MSKKTIAASVGAAVITFGVGIGIGSAGQHTTIKTVAGPTTTVTKNVPGPTKYKTVYEPASQGPAGTTVASYSGSGSQTTGSFNVPSSGDYIVKWSYSGNTDPSMGGATNFSIDDTNNSGMAGNEPNDIQESGSGSTEDTGMSGSQSFDVQATGEWSITVISAA